MACRWRPSTRNSTRVTCWLSSQPRTDHSSAATDAHRCAGGAPVETCLDLGYPNWLHLLRLLHLLRPLRSRDEVTLAKAENKPVVPILLRSFTFDKLPASLRLMLASTNTMRFEAEATDLVRFEALVSDITGVVKVRQKAPTRMLPPCTGNPPSTRSPTRSPTPSFLVEPVAELASQPSNANANEAVVPEAVMPMSPTSAKADRLWGDVASPVEGLLPPALLPPAKRGLPARLLRQTQKRDVLPPVSGINRLPIGGPGQVARIAVQEGVQSLKVRTRTSMRPPGHRSGRMAECWTATTPCVSLTRYRLILANENSAERRDRAKQCPTRTLTPSAHPDG